MIFNIVYVLIAYLLGNILGAKVVELVYNEKITGRGSGNLGARNAGRLLGNRAFLLVLAIDFFKGFLVVILLKIFSIDIKIIMICALFVILGHIKPALWKFKGGKGVATFFGATAALSLHVFLILVMCTVILIIALKSATLGFYGALPIVAFINHMEFKNYIASGIFLLIIVILYFVAIEDIEKSFEKYFSVKKKVVNNKKVRTP